jgi:type IV pilus assembly protein PilN
MIRINLLAGERKATKRSFAPLRTGQKLTAGCSLILVLAFALVGWRYWRIGVDSDRLDTEIAEAQAETQRLYSIIQQVQQFEQRRAQLQQRVALIEQLRSGQTGPVHMLDQISRALPPMLWLTDLRQGTTDPNQVTIDGRCTSLTGLSDFVANLEATGYFKRSVEIVDTQVESNQQASIELIRFSLRAQFQQLPDERVGSQVPGPGAAPAEPPTEAPSAN